jgi:hypothetical protein
MANQAYLYNLPSKDSIEEIEGNPLLAGDYEIPLLWLAMYDSSCFVETGELGSEYTLLVSRKEDCLLRLKKNTEVFRTVIENIDDFYSWFSEQIQMLEEAYIAVDITEIMNMPEISEETLEKAFLWFQDPKDELLSFIKTVSGYHHVYDAATKLAMPMAHPKNNKLWGVTLPGFDPRDVLCGYDPSAAATPPAIQSKPKMNRFVLILIYAAIGYIVTEIFVRYLL